MIRKVGLMIFMIPITSGTQPPENKQPLKTVEMSTELMEKIERDSIKSVNQRKQREVAAKEIEYVKSYFERDSIDNIKK